MDDLRFPVGPFTPEPDLTPAKRASLVDVIANTPEALRAAVRGLDDAQLDTPYREDGWTVRQVVHHVADSHLNSFVRFRWALTEDQPTIKTYRQEAWAELPDAKSAPVGLSLDLLDALHRRWVILLRSLEPDDWDRTFQHPELGPISLETNLQLYAWHGRHHVAHITWLRARKGW